MLSRVHIVKTCAFLLMFLPLEAVASRLDSLPAVLHSQPTLAEHLHRARSAAKFR